MLTHLLPYKIRVGERQPPASYGQSPMASLGKAV